MLKKKVDPNTTPKSMLDVVSFVVLVLGAFLILLPLVVVFLTSFAPPGASPALFQDRLSFANYQEVGS